MSPNFEVDVERRMYIIGSVTIAAENEDTAIEMVQAKIDSGELQTTAVKWGDPSYEDFSFMTTGDATQTIRLD